MGNHILKIASINNVTHDVLRITTNKPEGFDFIPLARGKEAGSFLRGLRKHR